MSASLDSGVAPLQYLDQRHPSVAAAFRDDLRAAVDEAGPLSPPVRELVMLSGYTAARQPGGFAVHCQRALQVGVHPGEIRHAVLLTLGASATLEMVVETLRWVDEICGVPEGHLGGSS